MRLKFLFFPAMLILSAVIFMNLVWPEVANLKQANRDYVANMDAMKAVKEKQSAVDSLGQQLKDNQQDESLVAAYLPDRKTEENILSAVNYLATDSGVSLANITIKSATTNPQTQQQSISAAVATSKEAMETGNAPADSVNGTAPSQVPVVDEGVQYMEASISAVGDYDKLKIFFKQIQRMAMYNSIKVLSISSDKSDDSKDGENKGTLSANLTVNFGFLSPVKIDGQKLANFKPEMDNKTVTDLKNYISQKAPTLENKVTAGKTNPFLP